MSSLENTFLDSFEIIANNKVQEAGLNKTVQATIIKMTDAASAQYMVKYQDSRFNAFSLNKNKEYKKGQNVLILMPDNDTEKNKIIIGAVEKEIEIKTAIENSQRYEIIGTNCVNSLDNIFELCSYTSDGDIQILYDKENLINLINLNTRDVQEYIQQSSILYVGADFRTNLSTEQQLKGNYGIVFELAFEDGLMKDYIVDINRMIGNPYKLNQNTTQRGYFEIGEGFQYVNKIYIFENGFPHEDENKENDIFIKNIFIGGAIGLTSEEIAATRVVLETPDGDYFSQTEDINEKRIIAKIKTNGMQNNINGIKFYWFKENQSIDFMSIKYKYEGGLGWEYLTSGPDTYIVQKADILSEDQMYKCVADIGGILYSQTVLIKNYDTEITVSIQSSNGTVFYYDMGETTLTCNVEGGDPLSEYNYYWTYEDDNEGTVILYDNINIQNVYIKDISLSKKYFCSVYLGDSYIGTSSIILYNRINVQDAQFQLKILNNDVLYQYDIDGNKPDIKIEPIKCLLYDEDNNEIDERIFSKCEIIWTYPQENTMLKDIVANSNNLTYAIEEKYDIQKNNNKIGIQIKLGTQYIYKEFSINFIKEGETGTNGTGYIGKIVFNANKDLQYPIFVDSPSGTFWNGIPRSRRKWLSLELWKDGKRIFIGESSGTTNENKEIQLKWTVLKNKYTENASDYSKILIDENENFYTYGYVPDNMPSAQIVQCEVEYEGIKLYCSKPLLRGESWPGNKIILKEGTGFTSVEYNSQGRQPQYQNDIFEIQVLNAVGLDITQRDLTFNWSTFGKIWKNNSWVDLSIVDIVENETDNLLDWQKRIVPKPEWTGECVNAGVKLEVYQDLTYIGTLIIPIHGYLNRNLNKDISDWNGNSVQLKKDEGGYIYSPQVGAGKKESDQSFTGMLMGRVNENGNEKIGLLGYDHGTQSLFLDAESGSAIFGKNTGGQIAIDSKNEKSLLYSHDYWKNYNNKGFPINYTATNENHEGMLIDLGKPEIVFGNGKCKITQDGYLNYEGGLTTEGILLQLNYAATVHNPFTAISTRPSIADREKDVVPLKIGYLPYGETFTNANGTSLPTTISYKKYGGHISFSLPRNFQVIKATFKCEYACPPEQNYTDIQLGEYGSGVRPYDISFIGTDFSEIFQLAPSGHSTYTNPSYMHTKAGEEPEQTFYYVDTFLDRIGIYYSDKYEEKTVYDGGFQDYTYPMIYNGSGRTNEGTHPDCLPNYILSWISESNNLNYITQINTSNADSSVAHNIEIDLTNWMSSLLTDKRYFLYLLPIEDFSSETVSYSSNNYGWTANKNIKEVIYDKWRRQIEVKGSLIIEGYIDTDAFE